MILSFRNVSYKYAVEPILDHADFILNEKEKWGVVGLNGSGKSTLLKLMAQIEKPDSGDLDILSRYSFSYCPQSADFLQSRTVIQTVQDHLSEKTEDYKIRNILSKLGISDFDAKISSLSGGQKKRVSLAIALIKEADVYLLDEPTNHLDQDMILWLEKYLAKVSKTVVLVTHDRYFLSRITNRIVEIDRGKLYCYEGNYADYLQQKEVRYQLSLVQEQKRRNFLRSEIEWIRAGAQARSTKQKSRIERYNAVAAMDAPKQRGTLELAGAASRLGGKIIEIADLSKSYDGKKLFDHFSYKVSRNDRLGIIGDNGAGKSTLLKIIANQEKADEGTVEIGDTVKLGYFSQMNEVFKENQRVIDYLKDFGEVVHTADDEPITASRMLENFMFSKEEQFKPVSKCSGGEKRRLYLCSILMQAPNVLLLDEPTNDLDTETLTILEDYLDHFKGAVLSVSHDRYFLDKTCDHLLIIDNGTITLCNQIYSDYLETRSSEPSGKSIECRPFIKEKDSTKLVYKEKLELEQLNREIPEYESRITQLQECLNSESDYKKIAAFSNELKTLCERYESMLERWMELSEKK